MVHRIRSGAVRGLDGHEVIVEIDAGRGLPTFQIVGLPGSALRESRERVRAAVRNCGLAWPEGRVTVNLAPADVRKRGAAVDLAIAIGAHACAAGREAPPSPRREAVLLGELSLTGDLRPVPGLLAIVGAAAARGARTCVVPASQAWEAVLVPGITVLGAERLDQVAAWYLDGRELSPAPEASVRPETPAVPTDLATFLTSVSPAARRLAAMAAAGRHNVLLVGPPGTGKTRLCRAIGALQPACTRAETVEVVRILSAAGGLRRAHLDGRRPFRAPHHTVTRAGLIGGGAGLRPGEVTLAHRGILFLDELPEFAPAVLDALREPLEEGRIAVARGAGARAWPADIQFLGAMNPCRCGFFGSRTRPCRCAAHDRRRYAGRVSGPLLDRIDLFLEMEEGEDWSLDTGETGVEAGVAWRALERDVARAHRRLRRGGGAGRTLDLAACRARLGPSEAAWADDAKRALGLSVRGVIRAVRVALTLAALAGRDRPTCADLSEALSYRRGVLAAFKPETVGEA